MLQMDKLIAAMDEFQDNNSKLRSAEGLLSMALIKRKFTYTIAVPKKFGSKQTKIQRKSFLFPDLQETTDATVVFELMKIKLSNQRERLKTATARNESVEVAQ